MKGRIEDREREEGEGGREGGRRGRKEGEGGKEERKREKEGRKREGSGSCVSMVARQHKLVWQGVHL